MILAHIKDTNVIVYIKNPKLYKNPNFVLCRYVSGNKKLVRYWLTQEEITVRLHRAHLNFIDSVDVHKYISEHFVEFL